MFKLQKLLEREKIIEDKLQQRKLEEDILKKAKMFKYISVQNT